MSRMTWPVSCGTNQSRAPTMAQSAKYSNTAPISIVLLREAPEARASTPPLLAAMWKAVLPVPSSSLPSSATRRIVTAKARTILDGGGCRRCRTTGAAPLLVEARPFSSSSGGGDRGAGSDGARKGHISDERPSTTRSPRVQKNHSNDDPAAAAVGRSRQQQQQRRQQQQPPPPPRTASHHGQQRNAGKIHNINKQQRKQRQQQRHGSERERVQAILYELVEDVRDLQRRVDEYYEPRVPVTLEASEIAAVTFAAEEYFVHDEENEESRHRRREVFCRAKDVVSRIADCTKDGTLQPSGKHHHEVSVLLERILRLYSCCSCSDNNRGESVFDECMSVLDLMRKEWKLDVQHQHCQHALVAAGREQRWKDAARLFVSRINPDDSGQAPFDVLSVSDPVGLYAVARFAQEQQQQGDHSNTGKGGNASVVDNVFDAVLRMSMVSPTDQNKCKFTK